MSFLVKACLFPIISLRILSALTIDLAAACGFPLTDLSNKFLVITGCAETSFPKFCVWHCNLRKKLDFDLTEFSQMDPTMMYADRLPVVKAVLYEQVILALLLPIAYIGLCLGTRWGKILAYWQSAMHAQAVAVYFYYALQATSNAMTLFTYNIADVLLPVLLFFACYYTFKFAPAQASPQAPLSTSTNKAVEVKSSKKKKR